MMGWSIWLYHTLPWHQQSGLNAKHSSHRLHAAHGHFVIGILDRVTIPVQAEIRHAELKKLGLEGKIVLIGKKGITYFNRRTNKYDIVGEPPAAQHGCTAAGLHWAE